MLIKDPASTAGIMRKPEIGLIATFLAYTLVVNAEFSRPTRTGAAVDTADDFQVLLGCIAINYVPRTEPRAAAAHDRDPRGRSPCNS